MPRLLLALLMVGLLPATGATEPILTPATGNPAPTAQNSGNGFGFVAGTLVATRDGRNPIDKKIAVGDHAWATDPRTRKSGYHQVTRIFTQAADDLITVLTSSREKIDCTPTSLFWMNTKSWVEAKSLFPGEELLQRDGSFTKVFNVIPKHAPKTPVYTMDVADFHTYYVGNQGILVSDADGARRLLHPK